MSVSHETPVLVLLPPLTPVEAGIRALLADDEVRHVHYPPLWCLDAAGINLAAALPRVKSIDAESLGTVLEALHRICDETALDQLVARSWQAVDERVRDYYLRRSTLKTMASIFRMGTPSRQQAAPASFRNDRIYENGFSIEYRLAAGEGALDPRAPAEEGTLAYHPFDPTGAVARAEAGISTGSGPALELFAYAAGRPRHRAFAERVARQHAGWTVFEPEATA